MDSLFNSIYAKTSKLHEAEKEKSHSVMEAKDKDKEGADTQLAFNGSLGTRPFGGATMYDTAQWHDVYLQTEMLRLAKAMEASGNASAVKELEKLAEWVDGLYYQEVLVCEFFPAVEEFCKKYNIQYNESKYVNNGWKTLIEESRKEKSHSVNEAFKSQNLQALVREPNFPKEVLQKMVDERRIVLSDLTDEDVQVYVKEDGGTFHVGYAGIVIAVSNEDKKLPNGQVVKKGVFAILSDRKVTWEEDTQSGKVRGLKSASRIEEYADKVYIITRAYTSMDRSLAKIRADREEARKGALALKDPEDIRQWNQEKYKRMLANGRPSDTVKVYMDQVQVLTNKLAEKMTKLKVSQKSGELGKDSKWYGLRTTVEKVLSALAKAWSDVQFLHKTEVDSETGVDSTFNQKYVDNVKDAIKEAEEALDEIDTNESATQEKTHSVNERNWLVNIQLGHMAEEAAMNDLSGKDDVPEIWKSYAKKVITKAAAQMKGMRQFSEDEAEDLKMMGENVMDVITIEDLNYWLEDLYDYADNVSLWIDGHQIQDGVLQGIIDNGEYAGAPKKEVPEAPGATEEDLKGVSPDEPVEENVLDFEAHLAKVVDKGLEESKTHQEYIKEHGTAYDMDVVTDIDSLVDSINS